MKPLLSIFIDGLKPESLEHMPFLNSFQSKRRIKGEHGYSIACHGSMYSGVHTDIHKLWFVWQYAPTSSPFRRVKYLFKIPFMGTLPGKLFLHKTAKLFEQPNTSFFGIPRVIHVPLRLLKYLDVSEKRNYDEPGYLTEVPSLFDIMREKGIAFEVIGMDKSEREESKIVERHTDHKKLPFIYWFIGDVDHFSHKFGQESDEAKKRLAELDALLGRKYEELTSAIGEVDVLVWSDHGHIDVAHKIDLYDTFEQAGADLNDYLHVIDGTYARFWFDKDGQEAKVRQVLESLKEYGDVMEIEDQKAHRVYPGDRRYGDLIFALRPGAIFSKTIWGWSRTMKSMHGYSPEYRESDGVLISNLPVTDDRTLELIDITPSIMERLELTPLEHMEGKSFWSH